MIALKKHIALSIILFCLFSFNNSRIFAQEIFFSEYLDSLKVDISISQGVEKVNLLNKLSVGLIDYSPDSALTYARSSLNEAVKLGYQKGMAEALNNIGFIQSIKVELDDALSNLQKSLEIFTELNDSTGIAKALNNLGLVFWKKEDYTQAREKYKESIGISTKTNDLEAMGNSYNYLGLIYWIKSDYSLALEYFHNSLEVKEKLNDEFGKAITLNNISRIYNELSQFEKSLSYSVTALNIGKNLNNGYVKGRAYNNMGNSYTGLNQYSQALDYQQKSLEEKEKVNDSRGIIYTLFNIGDMYYKSKDYPTALDYYQQALEKNERINDLLLRASIFIAIGNIYNEIGNKSAAINYYNRGLEISEKLGSKDRLMEVYLRLTNYYEDQKDFQKANYFLRNYYALRDTIYEEINQERITELTTKYEAAQKEHEIEVLKREQAIQNLKLEDEERITTYLTIILIFALFSAVLIYNRYLLRRKANKELEKTNMQLQEVIQQLRDSEIQLKEINNTKDKFFSIIAHDLKNPFNAMMGFSNLLKNEYSSLSNEERLEYINTIGETINQSYNLLENLLQWARSQTGSLKVEKKVLNVKSIIEDSTKEFSEIVRKKNLRIVKNISDDLMIDADPFMVNSILRNLINNAIKFSHPKNDIVISAAKGKNGFVEISVKDSGIGMSEAELKKLFSIESNFSKPGTAKEQGTGLGLLISKEFIEKNKGDIRVESHLGEGSNFIIELPEAKNLL